MRRECIQAVAKALGRDPTQTETRDIEQRVVAAARNLARQDPQAWLAKPKAQQLAEAGQQAAKELLGEAQLKAEREALQIAAISRIDAFRADMGARGLTGLEALARKVAFHADGKANGLSIESQTKAIRNDLLRQLIPVMEASNPKWFGLLENREGVEAIIKEIHGEDSGNPVAKAGAKIWHEVTEAARQRFNAAGGDVGKLDSWGMPHHHSQVRVATAAREAWLDTLSPKDRAKAKLSGRAPPAAWARDHWIADILPKLDREKYVNEDGSRMSDAQLTEFLQEAWTTIATGGANKVDPGQVRGRGMRANRGSASRSIHFKDAQSYIDYQQKYGERTMYEVLTGHIEGIAKDIALVEEFGPNPDHVFRLQRDSAVQEAKLAEPANSGKIDKQALKLENLYNYVAGRTQPVASERLAQSFDTLRNWLTASRLGGAVVSSLSDEATLHLTGHVNNLPAMKLLANELATLNPANKAEERIANRMGLALNTMLAGLNRFGQDGLGSNFSRKLANTVMRAQGLNAITDARRRAFGVTMMDALGAVAKNHADFGKLDPVDKRILESKGVTETDFRLWKEADLEDWGGNSTLLTPDSIYRIPDAKVDQVIGGKLAKMVREKDEAVTALRDRDAEDLGWVQSRATKLSNWLAKERSKVEAKLAKADQKTAAELDAARQKIANLEGDIDALAESWTTPRDADTPGVENQRTVGFYGKGSLRRKGVDEGVARERIRRVNSSVTDIRAALKRTKIAELEQLFERFNERRAELDEFTKDSNARIAKRQKVVDRLERELDPAIARARQSAKEQAVTRLLGTVLEETDMAVIEPGARERAMMGAGIQRGTWKGELARSFFLFKSFPISMLMRHWGRGMAQQTGGGKAAYIAALMASTTLLGAMAMQVKEVLAGRDPRNLNPAEKHGVRNWMKAMLQGGSLGIYGDFLFSEASQRGQSPVASFLGPVVGMGEDVFKLTQGNAMEALSGKDTHAGAEVVKFLQSNTPGANLWYAKAALDHMIFHQLQEHFSPGYLSKMRKRAQRDFGTQYWWEPGELTPDRAPDLENMAGQ